MKSLEEIPSFWFLKRLRLEIYQFLERIYWRITFLQNYLSLVFIMDNNRVVSEKTELGNSQALLDHCSTLKTVEARKMSFTTLLPLSTRYPKLHQLLDHNDVNFLTMISTTLSKFAWHHFFRVCLKKFLVRRVKRFKHIKQYTREGISITLPNLFCNSSDSTVSTKKTKRLRK